MADADLFLRLFSSPSLGPEGSGESVLPVGKPMALLAYLAVEDRAVPRRELAELLWPDADPARGKASVRQALWNLRKRLGSDLFPSEDPLTLSPGAVETDLVRFRAALEEGDMDGARALWTGALLEGLEFPRAPQWARWVDELRTHEERRFGDALAAAAGEARVAGDLRAARDYLEAAVEVQPYRADPHVALVETLLDSRAYRAADEALAAARRAVSEEDEIAALEEMEARLASLRVNGFGEAEPHSLRTEFVGRTAEFSGLATTWRRAREGRSELALVLGAPGIGKTRLGQELVGLVRSEGCTAVTVKTVEVERGLRWGTASELVRSLHVLPGAAGISNRSAAVLARLVPSLGAFGTDAKTTSPGMVEAAAVTDALLDLVSAVAEEGPLLLFVDDLQWVDRESRATLSHLARNLKREPVLILITCRTGEGDADVARAVESLHRSEGVHRCELSPLGSQEISELLALLLEGVEPQGLDGLAQRLHAVTQGNPLFVVEILKLLHGEGMLEPSGKGKWVIDRSCLEGRLPVPETVESAILRRLEDLGDEARLLALQLARQARPMPPEELRRETGLDPFQVSAGIGELFDRDLVRRKGQDRIQFVHDSVTEVARTRLGASGWAREAQRQPPATRPWTRSWIPWTLAAAVLTALAMAGMGGIGPLATLAPGPEGPGAAVPGGPGGGSPAGGSGGGIAVAGPAGRIFVLDQDMTHGHWLTPPAEPGGSWEVKDTLLPHPIRTRYGPYRVADDSLIWFARGNDGPMDPPYAALVQADGELEPFWEMPGDVGFKGLSPDGTTALVVQVNLDAEWYAHDLLAVDVRTRQARVLFEAPERINAAAWAPNGMEIALVERNVQDSVRIIDPRGRIVRSFGIEGMLSLNNLVWCPDSRHLALSASTENRRGITLLDSRTGDVSPHPTSSSPGGQVACIGSPPRIVFPDERDGRVQVMVLDVEQRRTTPILPARPLSRFEELTWVPDSLPVMVRELEIEPAHPEIRWGATTPLEAMLRLTDGSMKSALVTWESLDPTRVAVDSVGVVTGRQVGAASIVARYAGWLTDTVAVEVLEWERPDVVLQGDFTAEDLAGWAQYGLPLSRIVEVEGETVLSLEGDGVYRDGMVSRDRFRLTEGGRIELVFRLELNRPDRQRIKLCLEPTEELGEPVSVDSMGRTESLAYCLLYPVGEQTKLNAGQILLTNDQLGLLAYVDLPEELDTGEWTQFVLEIQPDGQVGLYVNGEFWRTVDVPINIEPHQLWHIHLSGASVETELHVRSLTVYSGGGLAPHP